MRVAVIGGGVIGAGIAWRLARRGVDVVLFDDRSRAGSASGAAGGMLAPLAEAHRPGPFLDLGLESLRRWPAFVAQLEEETGHAVGYTRAGKLIVALTAAEADDLNAAFVWQSRTPGAQCEWLDGAQARELEPELTVQARGAVLIRDDHRVDNVALDAAITRAAQRAGALFVAACVSRVLEEGGRARGVEAGGQTFDADAVVVAAGAWSGAVGGLPRTLPVRPVRGQMLALKPAQPLFGRTLASAQGYIVPRPDGRVVIGSTMEDVGFDAATTPDTLAALRAGALRLVPALANAARVGAWAGLRPATPDGLPVLGADPALPGLFYATGHFRNGILLTPVTADALAAAVLGEPDVDLAPYTPARFDTAESPEQAPGSAAPTTAAAAESDRTCDLCGAEMYEVHCKLICPSCGYKRDCSDLW